MLLGLDALGDHGEAQVVGEIDGRAHDHRRCRCRSSEHERLVDLELVQRQALEMGERGIAGAEVVDRQTDPELVQRGRVRRAPSGSCITAVSVSSSVSRRGSTRHLPSRGDDLGQLLVVQAAGREVDRDADVVAGPLPGASWASAASKLQWVNGWIRPVFSASGMNSSGRIAPRAGWRQRASASTLRIVSASRSSLGWNSNEAGRPRSPGGARRRASDAGSVLRSLSRS